MRRSVDWERVDVGLVSLLLAKAAVSLALFMMSQFRLSAVTAVVVLSLTVV